MQGTIKKKIKVTDSPIELTTGDIWCYFLFIFFFTSVYKIYVSFTEIKSVYLQFFKFCYFHYTYHEHFLPLFKHFFKYFFLLYFIQFYGVLEFDLFLYI